MDHISVFNQSYISTFICLRAYMTDCQPPCSA